jgi:hypothetical protein
MNIKQRLEALEISQPVNSIINQAAAVARLIDDGDLLYTAGRFVAGDNAPDTMPQLADLLNLAHERWERDQQ